METALAMWVEKGLFARHRLLSIVFGCLFLLLVSIQPMELHAQGYADLHDFNCSTDGCSPTNSGIVAQGRNGNLYGTLPLGGASGYGTVYKTTPSGTLTAIYNFSGPDGVYPSDGLTLGTDHNFYGTTTGDGRNIYATIFKITPSGTLTTLHSFTSLGYEPSPPVLGKNGYYGVTGAASAYMITSSGDFKILPKPLPSSSYAPLLLASNGNFYGVTYLGGNAGYGTVFKLSSSGAVHIIYNFDLTHGANPAGPVVQGSDGYLYGTTANGGTAANPGGVVFKLSLKGSITVLKNFDTQGSDGAKPFAGLVAGTDGNIYGTTEGSSGAPNGTIFKITNSGTFSVVHYFDFFQGGLGLPTAMQHTKGIIFGEATNGGANGTGVFWSLDRGIAPFVSIVGIPSGTSGTIVEILGQGFNTASSVNFGSGSASFNVLSDTDLTATVPDSGTTGTITVTTNGGTLNSKQKFKVIPVLTSFNPTSGPVGTQVTITGSGFIGAKTVTFGGVKATFTVNSGTQITATVPNGAVTGKIKVTSAGGAATSSGTFTVT